MSRGGTSDLFSGTQWIRIPTGVSYFPREIARLPKSYVSYLAHWTRLSGSHHQSRRSWTRLLGNVVYVKQHSRGGHFASHEMPESLANDLRMMFGKDGPAFGVVPGRSGYSP